jgi:hypothetical protein
MTAFFGDTYSVINRHHWSGGGNHGTSARWRANASNGGRKSKVCRGKRGLNDVQDAVNGSQLRRRQGRAVRGEDDFGGTLWVEWFEFDLVGQIVTYNEHMITPS